MAKTTPTGVRFNKDILESIEKVKGKITRQQALIMYENIFNLDLKGNLKLISSGKINVQDLTILSKGKTKDLDAAKKTNYSIDTMPVRKPGESFLDFSARKNEWKKKQK